MNNCIKSLSLNVKDKVNAETGAVSKSFTLAYNLGYTTKYAFASVDFRENKANLSEMLGVTIKELCELKEGKYTLFEINNKENK